MQVQKEVGQHHHDPVAAVVRGRMPEDALPDLRVANVIADAHDRDFEFRILDFGFRIASGLASLVFVVSSENGSSL